MLHWFLTSRIFTNIFIYNEHLGVVSQLYSIAWVLRVCNPNLSSIRCAEIIKTCVHLISYCWRRYPKIFIQACTHTRRATAIAHRHQERLTDSKFALLLQHRCSMCGLWMRWFDVFLIHAVHWTWPFGRDVNYVSWSNLKWTASKSIQAIFFRFSDVAIKIIGPLRIAYFIVWKRHWFCCCRLDLRLRTVAFMTHQTSTLLSAHPQHVVVWSRDQYLT